MLKTVGGFRYIEALCPLSWKVYGNESTVQTCMDQILTLQRDARAGVSRHNCIGHVAASMFGCSQSGRRVAMLQPCCHHASKFVGVRLSCQRRSNVVAVDRCR